MASDSLLGGLDGFFGKPDVDAPKRRARAAEKATRAMPQIRGKVIDGEFWVSAHDIADALESQAPAVNARLIAKLRSR